MENNTQFDYPALIGKYLSGEASPEEASEIHEWMQIPENKSLYENYVSIWNGLSASSVNEPNTLQAWRELESGMRVRPILKNAPNLFYRFVVAASTLAFVGTIAFFLLKKPSKELGSKPQEVFETALTTDSAVLKQSLKDGTTVTLNKNSLLSISSLYNTTSRNTRLSGEGYFEVIQVSNKPFVLSLDGIKIETTASSFNVKELTKEERVEVQVKSGNVSVYANDKKVDVQKSQTVIFNKKNSELEIKQAIDLNSLGYATGSFYFNDISLVEACKYLEEAFNVKFHFKNTRTFEECRITAEFINKPLDYILDVMAATLNINFNKKDRSISIFGKGCK